MSGPGSRCKGLASIWAPACQDPSHVGNAGIGVISMRGAPVALPSFATAQFQAFLRLRSGGAVPVGGFMHLVVLYGYQGADTDAQQHALTEQLFQWYAVCSLLLLASVLGVLVVVIGGTSWLVVPILLLRFYLQCPV